ncbi:MAG: patatin-like phospholipase family protein [Sandaracinaceae bacterium]|nr:patatin-like phospholipase family protein [Sandaracinaceae bacterium]
MEAPAWREKQIARIRRRIVEVCVASVVFAAAAAVSLLFAQAPQPFGRSGPLTELEATVAWELPRSERELRCMLPRLEDLADCGLERLRVPEGPDPTGQVKPERLGPVVVRTAEALRTALNADVLFIVLFALTLLSTSWLVLRHPAVRWRTQTRLWLTFLIFALLGADFLENVFVLRHLAAYDVGGTAGASAFLIFWSAWCKWLCMFLLAGTFGHMTWSVGLRPLALWFFASSVVGVSSVVAARFGAFDLGLPLWVLPVCGFAFGLGLVGLALSTLGMARGLATRLAPAHEPRADAAELEALEALELGERSDPIIGLALSGGGIRSATFNLGLLQALERAGVLEHVDYLSTVSGGGYVGGFWSMFRHRTARDGSSPRLSLAPSSVRHLREFGHFLVPRLGLFGVDMSRMIASVVGPMLPAVAAGGAILLLGMSAWLAISTLVVSEPLHAWVGVLGVLPVWLLLLEAPSWRRRRDRGVTLVAYLFALGSALAAAWGLWSLWGSGELAAVHEALQAKLGALDVAGARGLHARMLPALAWLAGGLGVLVVRLLFTTMANTHDSTKSPRTSFDARTAVAAADRAMMRSWLLSGLWALGGAVWLAGGLIQELDLQWEAVGSGLGTTVLFAIARRLFEQHGGAGAGSPARVMLRPWMVRALAWLALGLFAVGLSALLVTLRPLFDAATELLPIGTAFGVTVLVLLFLDPNTVGLHEFYRSRIVRAFLGAANGDPATHRATRELPDDDVEIGTSCAARGAEAPGAPRLLLRQRRLGRSARAPRARLAERGALAGGLLGRLAVDRVERGARGGPRRTDARPGAHRLRRRVQLADGQHHHGARPRGGVPDDDVQPAPRPVAAAPPPRPPGDAVAPRPPLLPRDAGAGARRRSGGAPLRRRALREHGRLRAAAAPRRHHRRERLRRRPRGALQRPRQPRPARARVAGRRDQHRSEAPPPRRGRAARAHVVVGSVRYADGAPATLVLCKPALTGDEPVDVQQYAGRASKFPHDSTGDQFFDEAQWESYRRLGEHTIETLLPDTEVADRAACLALLRSLHANAP